jgi:hypothetical protein
MRAVWSAALEMAGNEGEQEEARGKGKKYNAISRKPQILNDY